MTFESYQTSYLIMPAPRAGQKQIAAKLLVGSTRRHREGLRAFAPNIPASQQAVTHIDDRLVRLLRAVRTCLVDATLASEKKADPSPKSREIASKIAQDLFLAYRMHPQRVAASIEGGIMLVYRDHPTLEMEIEVDNEGDATGVIATDDKVEMSAEITIPAEFSKLVTAYRLSTASSVRRS